MIRTIIFDIGNVLTGFRWQEYFEQFDFSPEVLTKIGKATVGSPAWNEYDRGVLSDEEVLAAFIQNDPSIEKELRQSLGNVNGMLVRYDYAIPWIKELKEKGYQVLVLSNFSHKVLTDCAEAMDFLPYIDGGILSFREHCIKPEPEIYKKLIVKYQLIPEECVFLDDLQPNLDGAAAFGIHTILFQNQALARAELEKLGVK